MYQGSIIAALAAGGTEAAKYFSPHIALHRYRPRVVGFAERDEAGNRIGAQGGGQLGDPVGFGSQAGRHAQEADSRGAQETGP